MCWIYKFPQVMYIMLHRALFLVFSGPGGRFRMSPALARAQQADLQAAMGGNVGTVGPGGMTGIVPGGKIETAYDARKTLYG